MIENFSNAFDNSRREEGSVIGLAEKKTNKAEILTPPEANVVPYEQAKDLDKKKPEEIARINEIKKEIEQMPPQTSTESSTPTNQLESSPTPDSSQDISFTESLTIHNTKPKLPYLIRLLRKLLGITGPTPDEIMTDHLRQSARSLPTFAEYRANKAREKTSEAPELSRTLPTESSDHLRQSKTEEDIIDAEFSPVTDAPPQIEQQPLPESRQIEDKTMSGI